MITRRRSTAADATRIVQIWRDAVDATHPFLSGPHRRAIDREVSESLPKAPLVVAVDGTDRPVGFMLVKECHLEALFIHPECCGQGIGRALVARALEECPRLTADVNAQNARAVGFYAHLGFKPTGRSAVDGRGRPYPLIHMRFRGVT